MEKRIVGLDYIRAVMSVFVVIWHMGGDGESLFLKYHVLLLAVPAFILVSNFLFVMKNPNVDDLSKQVKRILILLGFWPIIFILYTKTGILGPVDLVPHSTEAAIVFLLRGGNTIYYFFVSLLFTSLLAYFLSKLQTRYVAIYFIVSCLVLSTIPLMDIQEVFGSYKLSYYFNPTNFLPYPAAAILIVRMFSKIENDAKTYWGTIITLLSMSVLFAFLEWNFYVDPTDLSAGPVKIPIYTRVSVVLFSIIILIAALNTKIPSNKTISFMSRHSLALYCLHPFLMGPVKKLVSENISIISEMPTLYISIIVVVLVSYILSVFLGSFLKKELIR